MNEKVETKAIPANTPTTKKGSSTWTIAAIVIIVVVILGGYIYSPSTPLGVVDGATTICIAENSVFYGTEWCSFCQKQKELFGINEELLNYIDCDEDREACIMVGIEVFPTWDINGERYTGVQSIEKLKELTGC